MTAVDEQLPVPPELTAEDREWVRGHLELAGWRPPHPGKPPIDTSWLITEKIRG